MTTPSINPFEHAHSLPTEQAVLSVLLDGRWQDLVGHARETLPTRQHFWGHRHQMVWAVMCLLGDAGQRVDLVTVTTALARISHSDYHEHKRVALAPTLEMADSLLRACSPSDLAEITAGGGSTSGFRANCQTLAEYWAQRQLILALGQAMEQAQAVDGSRKVTEIGSGTIVALAGLGGPANGNQTLADAMATAMRGHNMALAHPDQRQASWGIPILDKVIPLRPGRMVVLAAQPGHGKTSLALQSAMASAQTMGSGSVGVISLEMPADELGRILLARELRVTSRTIETGHLSAERMQIAGEVIAEWGKTDVYLRSSLGGCTVDNVCAWIRQRHIRSAGRLCLVVLDYLQLLDARVGRQTEQEKLSDATRKLKILCVELRICLLVLSQITREGGKAERDSKGALKGNPEPRMQDLRGSGTIEQDADAVVFIWPPIDARGDVLPVTFKVAKNRAGPRPDPIQAVFERANGQVFRSLETVASQDPADSDRSHHRHEPTPTEDLYAGENAG